ncbi:MAG TPA: LCP family protein [Gaiellaceae bacterium]|jgi:LCP family protein required for cell wall assembly
MRTSKKGGRGGSWGVVQPAGQSAAPALAAPVSVYQSGAPTRSVAGQVLRGFGWFLLVLLVIGAGVSGGLYLYAHQSLQAINGKSDPATARTDPLIKKLGSPNDPAVALIAGYDHRAGTGSDSYAGSNSDTLMLLRANPKNHTLSLLSFPRDLNVPIYCKGDVVSTHDRINAAWADCGKDGGPYAALDTVEKLTGVKPNYLITLDFNAFKKVVNRLKGVYINVDRRYFIAPHTGVSAINLPPGYQKLDGGRALSYVRFRHLDSDIYRNGRQQLFMEALKARLKQTLTVGNLFTIPKLIGALKGNLAIEKAGGGAVDFSEIKSYLGLLISLPGGHLLRNAIPIHDFTNFTTPGGAEELQASPEAIAAAVHRFLHPVVPTAQHAHKGGGKGSKTPKLPHKDISVLVLNAGDITGEAANTSGLLGAQSFAMKTLPQSTPANAPKQTRNTVIYYDPSQPQGQKAANVLAPLFGSHVRTTAMTPKIATLAHKAGNPLTVVAIGTTYRGKLKLPRSSAPHVSTKGAQVEDGVSRTLAAVRSQQPDAHFRLMVPHKLAANSSLSTDEGVRLFKVYGGKREFVLTFFLASGCACEYWQIEESNWTDAPLLANPTSTFKDKGRTYEEFTSNGAIQTIAVKSGDAVYWVQNSILNTLSNATMIAIAEGLQPHR